MLIRAATFALLFAISLSHSLAQDSRQLSVAIIGDEPSQNEAQLLLSALSNEETLRLVERDELDKVAREYRLASADLTQKKLKSLSQLLHADVLVILHKIQAEGTKTLVLRIVAVNSGVILGGFADNLPIEDMSGWSRFSAQRIIALAPKTRLLTNDQGPLIFLGLRSAVESDSSKEMERQINDSLSSQLLRSTKLCLVERWSLPKVIFEKDLDVTNDSPLRAAHYVLEGTFHRDSSNVMVEASLTRPTEQNTKAFVIQESGPELTAVIEQIVKKVETNLGQTIEVPAWSTEKEGKLFYEEAAWAYRWHLYDRCVTASENSWYLGFRHERLSMLRFASHLARGGRDAKTRPDDFG